MKAWLAHVAEYFRFVGARKPSRKYRVFPQLGVLAALLLSVFVAVMVLHIFADPVFIEWYAAGNADKGGLFWLTTDIGKSDWILIPIGCVLLFLSLYNFPSLTPAQTIHWHDVFLKFYFAFTSIAFSGLLAILLKNVAGRARPVLQEQFDLWLSIPFGDVYYFASFPSGHSTTAGAMAAVLMLLFPRVGLVFLPIALWTSISRIAVGAHFPSDVMAGFALGVIFTWFYARSFARKRLLFVLDDFGYPRLRAVGVKHARNKIKSYASSFMGLRLANKMA